MNSEKFSPAYQVNYVKDIEKVKKIKALLDELGITYKEYESAREPITYISVCLPYVKGE